MRILFFCGLMVLMLTQTLSNPVLAQSLKNHPGYVDFGSLNGLADSEPKVEISLSRALLGFLCSATEKEDEELASALCKLRSVRVSVFELDAGKADAARKKADQVVSKLEDEDWESAITVRSEDSTVHMYLKTFDDVIAGMTVMVIEPGSETIFMNIVGEIDPAQLGRVASKFGVSLDDLEDIQ